MPTGWRAATSPGTVGSPSPPTAARSYAVERSAAGHVAAADNRLAGPARSQRMRRLFPPLVVAALATALAGCTGGDDTEPHQPGPISPLAEAPDQPAPRPEIGTWTTLADLPSGRSELGAVGLDGMVYVAGGFSQVGRADRFYRYDPASDTWTELAPVPAEPHHAHMGAYDGTVYLVGGCSPVGEPFVCRPAAPGSGSASPRTPKSGALDRVDQGVVQHDLSGSSMNNSLIDAGGPGVARRLAR